MTDPVSLTLLIRAALMLPTNALSHSNIQNVHSLVACVGLVGYCRCGESVKRHPMNRTLRVSNNGVAEAEKLQKALCLCSDALLHKDENTPISPLKLALPKFWFWSTPTLPGKK
jgi:hypothetical protein